MTRGGPDHDIIVIGGGPVGATAALLLAREGMRVAIFEQACFPRFHVGESFLPRGVELINELGLEDRWKHLPHMPKYGAEFGFGHTIETSRMAFDQCLNGNANAAFNMERAPFDAMMLDAAGEAGVQVVEGVMVRRVLDLNDGDVAVLVNDKRVTGRYLFDASGQSTFLARHLGTREGMANHRKVSYFGHFENVKRLEGDEAGYPLVAICSEGWFWAIPIDERRTSIGLVMDADAARSVSVPAKDMLAWAIERCPLMRDRTARAVFPESTHRAADFGYYCRPYAGPGYFLLGDAAFFLDPVFSSGICLGMMGAVQAADNVARLLLGHPLTSVKVDAGPSSLSPGAARTRYSNYLENGATLFFKFVKLFYDHHFREMLLHDGSPLQLRNALISLLAGHVFPKPPFALRWRLRAFELLLRVQRHVALVPRREPFSLLDAAAATSEPVLSGDPR